MNVGEFPTGIQAITLPLGLRREHQRLVQAWLREQGLPLLPDTWNWDWKVEDHGAYTGTFPKRAAKYYFQVHGLKLTNDQIRDLGVQVSRYAEKSSLTYHLDFTQDLWSWEAGTFGDYGSCFWSYNTVARDCLVHLGGYAVRFWYPDVRAKTGYSGYGRALLAPIKNSWLVFNAHSNPRDEQIPPVSDVKTIARVIAYLWGNVSWKPVQAQNRGPSRGQFYVNSGSGALVNADPDCRDEVEFDAQYPPEPICPSCRNYVPRGKRNNFSDQEGTYCETCYKSILSLEYTTCNQCHQVKRHHLNPYEVNKRTWVCPECQAAKEKAQ